MCCERLVCATCAGPVSEARCGTCRAARATVHTSGEPAWAAAVQALALVLLALAVLALLTA